MIDVDTMEAGREMDALVAEKIFDEPKPTRNLPFPEHFSSALGQSTSNHNIAWYPSVSGYDSGDEPTWEPKPYSTDIAAALSVIEKLREDHTITIQECSVGWECSTAEGPWGQGDTIPLAVCRAALHAKEGRE